jgi:hypothetical protein
MPAERFVSATLYLAAISTLFAGTAAAQPASRPSLTVTPAAPINISGRQGGPFSPSSFQYRLSASIATIRFTVTPHFGSQQIRASALWVPMARSSPYW